MQNFLLPLSSSCLRDEVRVSLARHRRRVNGLPIWTSIRRRRKWPISRPLTLQSAIRRRIEELARPSCWVWAFSPRNSFGPVIIGWCDLLLNVSGFRAIVVVQLSTNHCKSSTLCFVPSVAMFCFVFCQKFQLTVWLHSSCSISPTAGRACHKCFTKHCD